MVAFSILFMLMCVILCKKINGKWINSLTIFCSLWGMILIFVQIGLWGMIEVSEKTYAIVCIGCVMFCLGYISHMEIKRRGITVRFPVFTFGTKNEGTVYRFNYIFILFLEIFVFLFEMIIAMRVLRILGTGNSFSVIHTMVGGYGETALLNGALETYTDSWIIMPAVFALIPICLLTFFEKCKYYRIIQIMGIIDLILYVIVHAGRVVILYLIVYLVILYSIYGWEISDRIKKRIKRGIAIGFVGIIVLTFIRKGINVNDAGAWKSILLSIYQYFSVPVLLLDYWIEIAERQEVYSYGMLLFHGPIQFITTFLEKIDIYFIEFNKISQFVDLTESTFISGLYKKGDFNAFVSMFYFFYLDFRWLGVILFSYIYGLFTHSCEYLGQRGNPFRTALYLLFAQSIIKSFGRWEFYLVSYCLAFLYLRMCFKKVHANSF